MEDDNLMKWLSSLQNEVESQFDEYIGLLGSTQSSRYNYDVEDAYGCV